MEQRRLGMSAVAADAAEVGDDVGAGADVTDSIASIRTDRRSPVHRVTVLSVVLAVSAAVLLVWLPEIGSATRPSHWSMLLVLALAFALGERFVFHIELRREAVSFSMSEVPMALALVFVGPLPAIALRVGVSLLTIWGTWRQPLYKLWFNGALFAFELSLAYTLVRRLAGSNEITDLRFMLVLVGSLAVTTFVSSLVLAVAISFFEGDLMAWLVQEARTSALVTGPATTSIVAMIVVPALFRPALVLLTVPPVFAAWMLVRRHGQLTQHHRDLQALHGFSGVVGRSLHLDEVAEAAVEQATALLRAERGALLVFDSHGQIVITRSVGGGVHEVPSNRDDEAWRAVFESEGAVSCHMSRAGVVEVGAHADSDLVAVPVRDGDGDLGLLVVADRAGARESFGEAELSRAGTLAEQLASSLRKSLLHAKMEHAALHDALTGSLNRRAFELALQECSPVKGECEAVFMLDLDRFKEINDTLGHHVGDRVLVDVCRRLEGHFTDREVIARFGGDEFAVLVRRPDLAAVRKLAADIRAESFTPLRVDDLDVVVTTSVGIALVDRSDDADPADVLRHADIAVYTAKREHTSIEIYRDAIDRRTPERLALVGRLRDAIEHVELEVHYQPKIDLVTSTVIGVEALVRWPHPSRGWVPPSDFIPVAEESGLVKQLTDLVLTTAVRTARGWHEAGYDLGVAVNLSTHDLLDAQLPHRVKKLLAQYDVPADRLTLEITESSLLADTPRTVGTIERLNALGVRLSLDDFGTGYSSLTYLRRLPVAEIKVDQSFVKNLLLDEQDDAIVRSTIDLGHNLGLQIVAEGIENVPVLDRLNALGCDIGQGYGISRPLSPEHFAAWLRTTEYTIAMNPSKLLA